MPLIEVSSVIAHGDRCPFALHNCTQGGQAGHAKLARRVRKVLEALPDHPVIIFFFLVTITPPLYVYHALLFHSLSVDYELLVRVVADLQQLRRGGTHVAHVARRPAARVSTAAPTNCKKLVD